MGVIQHIFGLCMGQKDGSVLTLRSVDGQHLLSKMFDGYTRNTFPSGTLIVLL